MADIKRFSNKSQIENGTQDVNLSLNDILISQHITGDNNDYKLTLAQAQAVPYGVCNSPANEDKTVVFSNYPAGFTAQVGTKILVKFTYGNTKGSVNAGTYPTLTAGGLTGAILAQGKAIANGAIVAGQISELIATPDGWNIDQNTREVTSDYTILSDGRIKQWKTYEETVNFVGSNSIKYCFLGLRDLAIPFPNKLTYFTVYVKNKYGTSPVCWYSSDNGQTDSLSQVLISFMSYANYTNIKITYTIVAEGY